MKRFIVFIFVIFIALSSSAATKTFDGIGGDGFSWNDPLNWSPTGVPVAGDIIIIDGGATLNYTPGFTFTSVTINASAGSLVINAGETLVTQSLTNNNSLIGQTGSIKVTVGPFITSGIGAISDLTGTIYAGVTPTISGGGIVNGYNPPIPLSPWAVVAGLGLIGTTIVIRRKKVA